MIGMLNKGDILYKVGYKFIYNNSLELGDIQIYTVEVKDVYRDIDNLPKVLFYNTYIKDYEVVDGYQLLETKYKIDYKICLDDFLIEECLDESLSIDKFVLIDKFYNNKELNFQWNDTLKNVFNKAKNRLGL